MSAPYLFSRAIDPFFAMFIGIAAAGVRINREEKEKGRSTQQSWESLKRRWAIAMEREDGVVEEKKGGEGKGEDGTKG